jgi:gp45 sliding clamp, C terminal
MKLSNETLSILKNYASINSGIEFKVGNVLRTISPSRTILAKATLKDSFPEDFCIYDLNQFLSVYSLYKDADVSFDDVNIILTSGKSKIKYRKTAKEMIVTTDKELSLTSPDYSFRISEDIFVGFMKSASVLQSPNIAFESDGDKIYVTCFDAKDDSAHTHSIEVANGTGTKFKAVFLTENMKMVAGTYDVEISSKGLASFKHGFQDIDYWIAIETKDSNFEV